MQSRQGCYYPDVGAGDSAGTRFTGRAPLSLSANVLGSQSLRRTQGWRQLKVADITRCYSAECRNGQCCHTGYAYNSCRNRHCPKCQGIVRRKWIQARLENLLPISYYQTPFTSPEKVARHIVAIHTRWRSATVTSYR